MQERAEKNVQTPMGGILLEMRSITKVYDNGVLANENVDFSVRRGEIHALMGENGAGKSTLMKVLFGNERPDRGTIVYDGQPRQIDSPQKAVSLGIGMVYQHFNLAEELSVAENIVVGMEPNSGIFFDKRGAAEVVDRLAEKYGFNVKAEELIRNISVSQKQKVEILKSLYRNSHLIILDEPTAVLTPQETQELFKQLLLLKEGGYTIIFISHKIDEVQAICDRLTIMRAGRVMGTYEVKELTARDISRLMVGRDAVQTIEKPPMEEGGTVLKIRGLSCVDRHGITVLDHVSLDLHAGCILGVAGVEGSGQKELAEILGGLQQPSEGTFELLGRPGNELSIRERRDLGMSYIHEDRMTYGVAREESITENYISTRCDDPELGGRFLLSGKKEAQLASQLTERFSVHCKSPSVPVKMLSGGNIQKVVVVREMSTNPKVLIASQPTRGIDVGAAETIHKALLAARQGGCAILLVSSDLNEVLELSDRLIVMHGGRITGFFPDVKKLTEEELGLYMLGLAQQSEEELTGLYDDGEGGACTC